MEQVAFEDALERDQAAAVVVDDTQDPHREDPQDPDGRQVEPPELAWARDPDVTRTMTGFVFESDDEVAATGEDAPEGLLRSLEREHAGGESLKLAFAEQRLLDMELDDRGLHGVGRPIPGSAPGGGPRWDAGAGQSRAA